MKKIFLCVILLISMLFVPQTSATNTEIKLNKTYEKLYQAVDKKAKGDSQKILVYLKKIDKKLASNKNKNIQYIQELNRKKILQLLFAEKQKQKNTQKEQVLPPSPLLIENKNWSEIKGNTSSTGTTKTTSTALSVEYVDKKIILKSPWLCDISRNLPHVEITNNNGKIYATKNYILDKSSCSITIAGKDIIESKIWVLTGENYSIGELHSKEKKSSYIKNFSISLQSNPGQQIWFWAFIEGNTTIPFYNNFDIKWQEQQQKWQRKEVSRDSFITPLEYLWITNKKEEFKGNQVFAVMDGVLVGDILVWWGIFFNNNTSILHSFFFSKDFQNQLFVSQNRHFSVILSYANTYFVEQTFDKQNLKIEPMLHFMWEEIHFMWIQSTDVDFKVMTDENIDFRWYDFEKTENVNKWLYIVASNPSDLPKLSDKTVKIQFFHKDWKYIWEMEYAFPKLNSQVSSAYNDIQTFTKELTKNDTTKEQKIKSVVNWLADNMKYNQAVNQAITSSNVDLLQVLWWNSDFKWFNFYYKKDWICLSYTYLAWAMLHSIWVDTYYVGNQYNGVGHAIFAYEDEWQLWYVEPQRHFQKETLQSIESKWYVIEMKHPMYSFLFRDFFLK